MASEAGSTSTPLTGSGSAAGVIARQDRIPIWSLSYLFIGIIGVGFLFTFFDIFDVTVSFIQTCTQIVPGCIPPTAANYLGLPVELNLAGYVVGALILAPLADRFGRREMLLFTLVLTGLGSLYNAFVGDYTNFVIARIITGLGIGADLALVNAYINEMAPTASRARYTSLIFIMSSLGAFFGIWLGLILTTPPTPFPVGLPFAIATVSGPVFQGPGWRIMYGIGALLAVIGILLRFQLPESPRWLISRGRVDEADRIVTGMEERARRSVPDLPAPTVIPVQAGPSKIPYAEIFGNPLYLRRTILLFFVWFLGYVTVYAIAQGLTVLCLFLWRTTGTQTVAAHLGGSHRDWWHSDCADGIEQLCPGCYWRDHHLLWLQPVGADDLCLVCGELPDEGTRNGLCIGRRCRPSGRRCRYPSHRAAHSHSDRFPGPYDGSSGHDADHCRFLGRGCHHRPIRHCYQAKAP